MKITTGIDIIEVQRIKEAICELGDNFLHRIYTNEEICYCQKSTEMQYQHFAARFAAKEAVFKALSEYINSREDILWREIEVLNEIDGRPKINLERLKKQDLQGLESIDISISHIKEYAVASVVAVFVGGESHGTI